MKKTIFAVGIFFIALTSNLPNVALSYYTTDQSVTRLSNSLALFSITYRFGVLDAYTELPTIAERTTDALTEDVLTYSISASEIGVTDMGSTRALIVSDAHVQNEKFQIDSNSAKSFTLYVALQLDATDAMAKYQLHVDQLPFWTSKSDEATAIHHLNPSELEHYVTPKIGLNKK